jgi:uncharacterized iron-regulated protein
MALSACAALLACTTTTASHEVRLFDLEQQAILSQTQALQRLKTARIVLVGEHHNNAHHHVAQLKVIQLLHNSGRKVAVGLEMFRQDSQQALDLWIAGRIGEDQFKPIYLDNWNFGWELYGPIFTYAKEHRIPMVGLNVSRKITAQVAYHGFESLTEDQKGALEGITCNVTAEYRDFIRNAYGAHGHGNMTFNRFCEAQLVWDTAMAVSAIDYLKQHPDTVLVILAGSGHARKLGIPSQLDKRTAEPYVVVLPETRGIFDANAITTKDADFILLKE